jgi:hypothetical protein
MGCEHSEQANLGLASGSLTQSEVPSVPSRYKGCAKIIELPSPMGGWTVATVKRAIGDLRISEIEKSRCIIALDNWANSTLDGIRGRAAR